MNKRIIVYRDELLPYSETFIPAQVENFSSYTGFYVGTSRSLGAQLPIPKDRSMALSDIVKLTVRQKKLLHLLLNLTGLGYPGWFSRLKELSPCLIHAHFGLDGLWALPIARKLGIPLIVTFHGYDITMTDYGLFYRFYLWRRHQLFREASYCIAVSNFIRSKLIEKGCASDKVIVHYVGIDVEKFRPDVNVPREPIVLFVGRLVEKKGCAWLIRAIAKVQAEKPEVELVILGDGPLRRQLEELAGQLLHRYTFLGVQPPEVVHSWMNRALLLSAPSVTASDGDSEGLPTVLMEAQAMKLPVVSTIHAGIPEAVIHGETGFLAQEKDWETLAKYILTLVSDAQLRDRFAIAGRKRVDQEFNLKRNSAKLEAIYDRILNEYQ